MTSTTTISSVLTLPRKVWALLTKRERWQLAGLCGVVFLMGLAQVVGVGSIAPFVSVLIDPSSAQTNQWLKWAFDVFGFESTSSFLIFLALVVLAAVIIANCFVALTQWMLVRFGWALQYRLSRRLLEAYLAQPYADFLGRNSADTGKNVLMEVERFIEGVALPLLQIVAFGVSGLLLLAGLIWVNVVLALSAIAILAGGYAAAYLTVRRILRRAGERRLHANAERFKLVYETFGGIKEIKVLGRESGMLAQYDVPARLYANSMGTSQIAKSIPSYALQVLAVGLVVLTAGIFVLTSGGSILDAAPLLALSAFAAQRMVPFFMSVFQNCSEIRFNGVVVDTIYDDMTKIPLTDLALRPETRLPFRHELRLEGVTFAYPGADRSSIRDVTVSIPHRSFVAFVGATGAGKTTLVDIIIGLLKPDEGAITVDGKVLDDTMLPLWQNNLGYVPQDIYLVDDSIAANIAIGVPPKDRKQVALESAARIANIHDFIVDELPNGYDTIVGERGVRLSGGERQRIGIARALYHDPEVLVLDEATSNLDQGTEAAVHQAIEQAAAAKTVIMIAHRLSVARHCDVLYLLDHGCLVAQGTYNMLLGRSERFRAMAEAR